VHKDSECEEISHALRAIGSSGLDGPVYTREKLASVPGNKGAYLLLITLRNSISPKIRKREFYLPPGLYIYAGSAKGPGGLQGRLNRHFKGDKKPHWHVDQLTKSADFLAAIPVPGGNECELIANCLKTKVFSIAADRFGSTDCNRCAGHLLRFLQPENHKARVKKYASA
jgi:Uri superfamily endonuclease